MSAAHAAGDGWSGRLRRSKAHPKVLLADGLVGAHEWRFAIGTARWVAHVGGLTWKREGMLPAPLTHSGAWALIQRVLADYRREHGMQPNDDGSSVKGAQ